MANYLVITEMDESNWLDKTGIEYHYPSKYKGKIQKGISVVYYKGRIQDSKYQSKRLSNEPHYFGTGVIDEIRQQPGTNNFFAKIKDYNMFNEAISFKEGEVYLENKANEYKAANPKANYFRGNAVRELSKEEYDNIISRATLLNQQLGEPYEDYEEFHTSNVKEGKKTGYYTTKYERSKINRDKALKLHGYNCCICDINFKETYGDIGEGFIHIHHVNPLYSLESEVVIDPSMDLVPVCPNCHAIIHRQKGKVISIEEMRHLYSKGKRK